MRLTVMGNMANGLGALAPSASNDTGLDEDDLPYYRKLVAGIPAELERLKWFLWHGNVFRALQVTDDLEMDLEILQDQGPEYHKLLKTVREFGVYLWANTTSIPNYGERYRASEVISSAFAESTVNQVVSKRMVKKQQMHWTPRGAHLLLQVRTRVLNNTLADDFHRWYPGFTRQADPQDLAA